MRIKSVPRYAPRGGARHAWRVSHAGSRRLLRRLALLTAGCALGWLLTGA